MPMSEELSNSSPAFRLMIATSWLAPGSWQIQQEKAIREAIEDGLDWTEYIRLVDRHRTPALSWAALNRVPGIVIPSSVREELRKRSDISRIQAVRHCIFLAEVLKAFNSAGIPVMPCKGPMLSDKIYGDVGLRQAKDIDLAVEQQDLQRVRACLEERGWQLDASWFPMTPRQWEKALDREPHLGFWHSVAGVELELHWRNWWDTPEIVRSRWAHGVSCQWQGCQYQAMSSVDLVLYLCSHGVVHLWERAKWLGDLARIQAIGEIDWDAAHDEGRRTGQQSALLAGLQMVNKMYGLPFPALKDASSIRISRAMVEIPVKALKRIEEGHSPFESPVHQLRMARYHMLLPSKRRLRDAVSNLVYHREDFKTIRLPDRLFGLYILLRPVLWAYRFIAKTSSRQSARRA